MKFFFSLLFIVLLIWIAIACGLLIERQREANKPQPIDFDFRGMKLGDRLPDEVAKKNKVVGLGIEWANEHIKDDDMRARVDYGIVNGKIGRLEILFERPMDAELEIKYGKYHRYDSSYGFTWETHDGQLRYRDLELSISSDEFEREFSKEIQSDAKRRSQKL